MQKDNQNEAPPNEANKGKAEATEAAKKEEHQIGNGIGEPVKNGDEGGKGEEGSEESGSSDGESE